MKEIETGNAIIFLEQSGFTTERATEIVANLLAQNGVLTYPSVLVECVKEIGKMVAPLKEEIAMLRGTLLRNRRR